MATVSITKRFIVNDDKVCDKLIAALEAKPEKKPTIKKSVPSYERGKELLAMRYCRDRNNSKEISDEHAR